VSGGDFFFSDVLLLVGLSRLVDRFKYYLSEPESAAVQARLDVEDQVFPSELARAELMAVFHRRLRERKWTGQQFHTVVRQFSRDDIGGYWSWAPLDGVIVEQL
jgi:hypothetical protein